MAPTRALVREPGDRYRGCISSHPDKEFVDLSLARMQHAEYCRALAELGIEVIRIPRDDIHPDSCFVEDNAVIHGGKALICRMAKESRRDEETAIENALKEFMPVKRAMPPATVEGGDVIHLPDRLISGITDRTNKEGIDEMERWLEVQVHVVFDPNVVHLKSYITYLGRKTMIATKAYADHPVLSGFNVLIVPKKELYAANTLTIDDVVLMPEGFPEAHSLVREAGFDVRPLAVSEFEKCEGALTCLSLLF